MNIAHGSTTHDQLQHTFHGVSAFPLTPMIQGGSGGVDEKAFADLVARAASARVASIGVLGSTGSYMYLSATDRARVVELAVAHAAGVPVLAGVGAISTREVLEHVRAAQLAGAQGLIVAPVSYQQLSKDEVFELYRDVSEAARVPIVVYDNPGTTGFNFSLELYARVAALPGIASIKIPPPPPGAEAARVYVDAVRAVIPQHVTIGVSGDASAAAGLIAGCDAWYSVIAGVLPEAAVSLAREATQQGACGEMASGLSPVLELFGELGGSLRVAAAIAEELSLVGPESLPRPVLGLAAQARERVRDALRAYTALRPDHVPGGAEAGENQ